MGTQDKEKKGIVKKVDGLGRITIPKIWRQYIGITAGAELNVFIIDDNTIGIKLNRSTL